MGVKDNPEDYKVGYRRPPKEKQFRKGQSGNPSGRPKGSRNLPAVISKVCFARVRVKGENGRQYYISKVEAIMTQLANQAIKGDTKAAGKYFEILKAFPAVIEGPPIQPPSFHIHFVKPKHEEETTGTAAESDRDSEIDDG
jgi:hypothetical protein